MVLLASLFSRLHREAVGELHRRGDPHRWNLHLSRHRLPRTEFDDTLGLSDCLRYLPGNLHRRVPAALLFGRPLSSSSIVVTVAVAVKYQLHVFVGLVRQLVGSR